MQIRRVVLVQYSVSWMRAQYSITIGLAQIWRIEGHSVSFAVVRAVGRISDAIIDELRALRTGFGYSYARLTVGHPMGHAISTG